MYQRNRINALNCRVSTDGQQTGLESQIRALKECIVLSFSRFTRSTSHLLKGLQKLKEKNTRFISITESIDTNSPLGVALYTILGALAQLEREMIIKRVRAGMANAKDKGKKIGRTKLRNSVLIRSH